MNRTTRHITITATAILAAASLCCSAANARPDPINPRTSSPHQVVPATEERPCFMVRANWNESLDGPQPTCPNGLH
ncbi:hypothetical protein [Nocardioides bizhenqiangii]|uniref:Secreted protein n=1 Tax=Nocardioides bizhenqiangii TaxID=3095076 RepID=A0ABZ0ZKT3_9ACTN|nr:hypothetical protein [Nocardioides sp. HM61]WQQ24986.1 hypothetical protein SHK19_13530 [Nocardioides sp. HM61]